MPELTLGLGIAYALTQIFAALPIIIGAKRSTTQTSAEVMTSGDAYMFPFIGSAVLFSLYMIFKFFSKDHINLLLTIYFMVFGVGSVVLTIAPWIAVLFPASLREKTAQITFTSFWSKEKNDLKFTMADVVAFFVALGVSVWYFMTKSWIANNILGLSFSIQGISMLSLGSFKIGCILLGGLFFYDIFWVFGTEVMVSVARNFDAPIKLVFPKNLFEGVPLQFSLLGLGDIVIPGIFIALMLRFDIHRDPNGSRVYFIGTMLAYVSGLVTTVLVMHNFEAAQPALLYLVPFCLGTAFLIALCRGEIKDLFAYTEEGEEEEDAAKKGDAADTTSTPKRRTRSTSKKD
eukprot:TRINITY_DN12771_c0_g1_i1.p1 TRINITY_DN12771_c0_g1~~TRINITY_DN12771_c0_g1_i1.p1  ORF type:complete len:356 (-),score=113.23 TRINITY_DN12771_c0_g1_i1:156-1193(-)